MLRPHATSGPWTATHYGVFIPQLPAPHRYLNTMTLIGATDWGLAVLDDVHTGVGVDLGDGAEDAQMYSSYVEWVDSQRTRIEPTVGQDALRGGE